LRKKAANFTKPVFEALVAREEAVEIFFTILAGVLTFVLGQVVIKLFIEPVHSMKRVVADISHKLILYANLYANPKPLGDESQDQALKEFRELSSRLHAAMSLIPIYPVTSFIFGLPKRSDVVKASSNLIGLYNGHDHTLANQGILNSYSAQHVRMALGIYIPEGERLDPEKESHFVKAKDN
jgi:hypothetical protein